MTVTTRAIEAHVPSRTFSEAVLGSFLDVLRVVESRKRRVRALYKDAQDQVRAEFTIRSQSVEPGVVVEGELYLDPSLESDAAWLGSVVSELSEKELTSAQFSRKLIRKTSEADEAAKVLRTLTSRALVEVAKIATNEELTVEFSNSGPKRGPVYQFRTIELLAELGEDYATPKESRDVVEALATFADTVWYFRTTAGFPTYELVPVIGTQGNSTVDETLMMSELSTAFLRLGERLRHDAVSDRPIAVHHVSEELGLAWVATGREIALARLSGPRAIAAIGTTSRLLKTSNWR